MISENYKKTKQKSKFSENEKFQFNQNQKKVDSKTTTNEIKTNLESKTKNSFFQYLIVSADFKLASISHV